MNLPFEEIEKKLDYTFRNKNLLKEAFTHKSYGMLHKVKDNDRLEYLGDAVLEMVVTQWQYTKDSKATAGQMTFQRQKIVCKDALDSATDGLGVWRYLIYEGSNWNIRGKAKSSLFEAIIGAIYLDGGYQQARRFILEHGNLRLDLKTDNPTGELQEYLQAKKIPAPQCEFQQKGANNFATFYCILTVEGETATGEGKTKKEARATASARLLWELKQKEERFMREKNRKK